MPLILYSYYICIDLRTLKYNTLVDLKKAKNPAIDAYFIDKDKTNKIQIIIIFYRVYDACSTGVLFKLVFMSVAYILVYD